MRETDVTLETHFPEIYKALKNWAHDLIDNKGWSPQEMEFTFEGENVQRPRLVNNFPPHIKRILDMYREY